MDQRLFVESFAIAGADLIQGDLGVFAFEATVDAGGIVAALGGHGRDDYGLQFAVHFIGRDHDAGAGFLNFGADSEI